MDDMYFDPGLRPHSPWDYRTLPSSFWDPFYMDEFSHVGSEMLGGSTYLPPEQERQPYVDGIRVLVKYVGVIGISEPKNPTAVTHAITRVRSEQKATGSRKVLMNLIISARGLQMIDKASGTLRDTFPLEKVSYACVFTNDRKVPHFPGISMAGLCCSLTVFWRWVPYLHLPRSCSPRTPPYLA
eukprot:m.89472 g.89472  ORF g.89472 m.89472 type:complete len:184 (-) comp8415_c0_seq2:560-1111(-)